MKYLYFIIIILLIILFFYSCTNTDLKVIKVELLSNNNYIFETNKFHASIINSSKSITDIKKTNTNIINIEKYLYSYIKNMNAVQLLIDIENKDRIPFILQNKRFILRNYWKYFRQYQIGSDYIDIQYLDNSMIRPLEDPVKNPLYKQLLIVFDGGPSVVNIEVQFYPIKVQVIWVNGYA